MLRHKRRMHVGDDEMDEHRGDIFSDENDNTDSDNHMDSADDDDSNENTADSGSDDDPWYAMINRAFDDLQPQFDEKVKETIESEDVSGAKARADVYKELRPFYRKAIVKHFLDRLLWFDAIRRDKIYKAIRDTAKRLRDEEEYQGQESWQYATKKRKYLFDKLLADYDPPENASDVSGSEDEHSEEDE